MLKKWILDFHSAINPEKTSQKLEGAGEPAGGRTKPAGAGGANQREDGRVCRSFSFS